jgi:hypothetical protein
LQQVQTTLSKLELFLKTILKSLQIFWFVSFN